MEHNFDLAPQAWATLRRLLDEALDLPAAERDTWVDRLGGEDAEFKPRLRALLAHADGTAVERLLQTLPKIETGAFAGRPSAERDDLGESGQHIGPYRLLRQIGEGGMASVWLAERSDLLQGRQVALKLPHGAWRRAAWAARLAREREILATLEHPHIARLYDAGVAADGQPYLALEYIEGQRIDVHCRERGLDVRQRLGLFMQVAHAVAHAHSRLVVHRDLKPSNILVTADGQVRLLDFGIAKLLEQGLAQETELTLETGRALTPDYAAPEQIRGEPIGTAADIYSLGVVLFELLTGERPYKLRHDSRAALEDAILKAEPPRPSDAVADLRVRRLLRGDLDAIVLKTLKKAPAERWSSAAALVDDLDRWLNNQPVLARPDSSWYRAHKFLRRNRFAVAAGASIVIAIAGGAGFAFWQMQEARAQRDAARIEAKRADRIATLLEELFSTADPQKTKARDPTVREVLERGATRVRRELKDEPLLQARMLRTVGDVYTTLGVFAEATPTLEDALRLARDQGPSGQTEMVRGLVALGRLKRQVDDLGGAEAALRAAVSIQEQAGGEMAADLGSTLNQLALVLRHKDPEQALRLYQRSLAATDATRGRDSGEAGVVLANIGSLQLRTGRYEEARRSFEQSLPLVSKHHGESDPRVSGILGNLAIVERELGNLERAVELHQRDLEHSSHALGAEHPAVGTIWLNLARTTMRLGDHERALSQIDKAAAILRASLAPHHALVLSAEVSRLRCLFRLGRLPEARRLAAALIALDGTSAEGKTVQLATTLLLAEMESLDGRSDEALRLIAGVLDDPLSAKSGTTVPDALWARACVLARQHDTAADDARRAASAAMKGGGRSAREAALVAEARYAACAGDARKSAQWLEEAVKLGFRDRGVLFDPSFATVRKDAAFAAVRASLRAP